MASAIEDALAAVKTTLLTVNGTGSYSTTLRAVFRDMRTPESANVYPSAAIVFTGEDEERTASNQRRFYLAHVTIVIYAQQSPGTVITTALNAIARDVILAMTSPTTYTHGNTVIRTIYRGGREQLALAGEPFAAVLLPFDLHYANTWTAP